MKVIAFPKVRQEEPVVELVPDEVDAAAPGVLGGPGEGGRIDRITVRVITVALFLSLFIHVVVLLAPFMPKAEAPPPSVGKPLTARLEPQESSSRVPPQPQTQPDIAPPPPKTTQRQPTPPRPRIAVPNRVSPITVPPTPPAPAAEPQPQVAQEQPKPQAEDMASYVESRRRARGAPPQEQGETDDERAKRIALGNIQAQQRKANPEMVDGGGGIFSLDRTGLSDADFVFHGWSTDFKRNVGLTVHVTRGDSPDIKLAVVRKMIAIIRERKNGDFEWYSPKRGKSVTMSARPGDTERLELFLLHEFYPEDPRGRDVR